jgi:SET domain-containing protein
VATEIDPPASIQIRESSHGRGVFATAPIAAGETIEKCPVIELSQEGADWILADYVVYLAGGKGFALMLGYGSLYNHSTDPSAEYVILDSDAYEFTALRDIQPGEEITISYGADWWSTRGLAPETT